MAQKEPKYLAHLRQQKCAMAGHGKCFGIVQAHHPTGGKGLGQKNADDRAFSLCTAHHTDRHAFTGPFASWNKAQMREWERTQTAAYRRVYLGLAGDGGL